MNYTFLFIIVFLIFVQSRAADIELVRVSSNEKRVVVDKINLPVENLKKSLKSGLSNIFFTELVIGYKNQLLYKKNKMIKIYFDLWDEIYIFKSTISKEVTIKKILEQSDVLKELKKQEFETTIKLDGLNANDVWFKFSLVVDPISKEKQKKITKWLAQNMVNVQSGSSTSSSNSPNEKKPSNTSSVKSAATSGNTRSLAYYVNSELKSSMPNGSWSYSTGRIRYKQGGNR